MTHAHARHARPRRRLTRRTVVAVSVCHLAWHVAPFIALGLSYRG